MGILPMSIKFIRRGGCHMGAGLFPGAPPKNSLPYGGFSPNSFLPLMKTLALILAAVLGAGAICLAGPEPISSGKEMKQPVVPANPCGIDWTGFYLGLHAGGGFGEAETDFEAMPDEDSFGLRNTTKNPHPDGFIGGLQLGYNYQIGSFVLGAETDFSGTNMDGSKKSPLIEPDGTRFDGGHIYTQEGTDWFGTVRGRLGFTPWCRVLLYATGGLAYGDVHYSADVTRLSRYPVSFNETNVGWTVGGGLEYALTKHWSAKLEYLYYDLGDQSATGKPVPANPPFQAHYDWETIAHTFNVGMNYKF